LVKDDAKHRKSELLDRLRRAILTLEFAPGSNLDEARLSEDSGLSRTPLREVLRQLAGEGFTELHENRGARVTEMTHTTLRDFFLAAPMIYGAVMRLAARNAGAGQILALRAAQSDFRTALEHGSTADRALANNRFHEITGQMAGNTYLLPSFRRLLIDHARISMTFYDPTDAEMQGRVTQAADQHDAIITAIAARDEEAAAQLADDHWALSRDQIERFVMPTGLNIPLGDLPQKLSA
jgi:DNA-binding GntR family transcriptional regulator